MSIDDAIQQMKSKITAVNGGVEMKVVKISDEEAAFRFNSEALKLAILQLLTQTDGALFCTM